MFLKLNCSELKSEALKKKLQRANMIQFHRG